MIGLLKKGGVLIGCSLIGGIIGLVVPSLFDRDVGGALVSVLVGIGGLIAGLVVGVTFIRRRFD